MSIFSRVLPAANDQRQYVAWLPSNPIYEDPDDRHGRLAVVHADTILSLAAWRQRPWRWAPSSEVEALLSAACRPATPTESRQQADIDRTTSARIEAAVLRAEEIERLAATLRHALSVTPHRAEHTTCHAKNVTGLQHAGATARMNEQTTDENATDKAAQP
jgi:hypothetical protein